MGVTTPTHRAIVEVERLLARPIVAPPTELDDLVGHIIDVHHASARQWLAVLGQLVAGAEISRLPGGSALQRTVARVTAILAPHLAKEERVVFPYMRRLGDPAPARARFASLAQPLRQLDDEHGAATSALASLRRSALEMSARAPGPEALAIFATAARAFEDDLARHLMLEDAVLFPFAQLREHRLPS
ncbi:MAG: hemerythrin domain-containing protein [Deltaproteobacteria bacterium]|nr:hemerythrin domain-containing protein [Kofleriaceae bacterium]